MSLTNRLSLFFLAALALVLCGFSVILYALAHRHLHAQTDQRLEATMHTLTAAIEVHPGDVEWEPLERKVALGEDPAPDQVRWSVHDPAGKLIDCSVNLGRSDRTPSPADRDWRVLVRQVRAGRFEPETVEGRERPFAGGFGEGFPEGQAPGSVTLPHDRTFHGDALLLTVAVAEGPVQSTLFQLALAMAAVSTGIWLTAAVWGRWLCRRGLHPIFRMAASARAIRRDAKPGQFLDVASTGDELEELGGEFNALLIDLRESLERQQRFTGDASHQLRTPLTALLASVEVAMKRDRSPEEYRRVLDVVRRRGDQIRQIIESLLFLARAESSLALPEQDEIELGEWCRSRLDDWAEHPRASDLSVSTGDPVVVRTHQALLGQVLDNLLDNACKYSQPQTSVTVVASRNELGAIISVSDGGCGIAAGEMGRVFEPFFRSPQARWVGAPGVGLGLTVAQRLVALLGGRIEVRSELSKGSRFRIVIPLDSGATEAGQTGQRTEAGSRTKAESCASEVET